MRTFRSNAPPLLLIGIWSFLEAAAIAAIKVLPGDPSYAESGSGSLGQAVFLTAVLVVFVAAGSRVAWYLAIFSATVGVALPIVVLLEGLTLKPFLVLPLAAAALWLIWSRGIEDYVQPGLRSRVARLH